MDPYNQNQYNYGQIQEGQGNNQQNYGQNYGQPYGQNYGGGYVDPQTYDQGGHRDSVSENPLVKEQHNEIRAIDNSLRKDYVWYLIWLWFDFFLNIGWLVYVVIALSHHYGGAIVIISLILTIFILITISYGLSAFNAKISERQRKFIKLLRILIVLYVIDGVLLIFKWDVGTFILRLCGIVISLLVLYTARDLEVVITRREKLVESADRLLYNQA